MARTWIFRPAWLALPLLAIAGATAFAADVTVFAAASLKDALDQQVRHFQSGGTDHVAIAYAGSNALAKQIEAGAPADIFIAADLDWMDYVDSRKLLAPGTRVDLLRNALVLVEPADKRTTLTIGPAFGLSTALGADKLAMANPDSVPAGKYGKAALEHLGVWRAVEHQVVRADNVRAALAFVARREAAFGIVYATDAFAEKNVRIVGIFPVDSHPPIVYPAALVASSKSTAARPLLHYLASPPARAIWAQYGFIVAR